MVIKSCFDQELMQKMGGEMVFMQQLAHAGKIAQGLLSHARKNNQSLGCARDRILRFDKNGKMLW